MKNDRPIENIRIQEALAIFHTICERYDLTGGVYFADGEEMGFSYQQCATWNANIPDPVLPLGFRIRVKSADLGHERAHDLLEGSAWVIGTMRQFGKQTLQWGNDLQRMFKRRGVKIESTFPPIPHLDSE